MTFKYKLTKDEALEKLRTQTLKYNMFKWLLCPGDIFFAEICGKFIMIKVKKPFLNHAMQRSFVGIIKNTEDGCEIKGVFKYPTFSLVFLLVITVALLKSICYVTPTIYWEIKDILILGTFLLLMCFVIAMFFVTGITAFKKEEVDVINLLENLEKVK